MYYSSDDLELDTQVLSCTPESDGQFCVILASTLFHPQGGGQPSDQGKIGNATMLKAVHDEGRVLHYTDMYIETGEVRIYVDEAIRNQHARYHSAGHLIAYVGEKFGWDGYKGNHRPTEGRIVFKPKGITKEVTEDDFAKGVKDLISDSLSLNVSDDSGTRMVGWGHLMSHACGGTHVKNTHEIGQININRVKVKKGELSVQYDVID
ncbi:alanyl-tRNA editing protein [Acinetobacter baumannii]